MSITVDANVLLYASDDESPRHAAAGQLLRRLADGPEIVYLFWPVIMAYLRISTHPSIFARPMEPAVARGNIDRLMDRPNVRCPGEGDGFWRTFRNLADVDVIRGNLVTDSHIAALMLFHGATTIYTSDRDFRRFPGITPVDPYTDGTPREIP